MTDATTLSELWLEFRLPILMSLLGGMIGHFVKNGIIELPKFIIEYHGDAGAPSSNRFWSFIRRSWLFLIFLLGYRGKRNAGERIYFDLGFLGDLLIATGTGILAKTALAIADTDNPYAVISSALLAGYAGLSYLRGKANDDLSKTVPKELTDATGSSPRDDAK